MGRLTEDTNLAFLKTFDERLITTGTMRIEDILRIGIALAHGLTDLFVAVGGATDERGDALVALAIEVVDACEIRGIAYVHRISERLLRGLRFVLACLEILEEDIVGIVGSDESLDGQSHGVAEEGCTDITEVATGHTHYQI